jgi:hypothetical protein
MTQPGEVRHIVWIELFPWLIIFRTFRISIAPSLLAVATLAVLIAPFGWRLAGFVFLPRQPDQTIAAPRAEMPRAGNSQLAAFLPDAAREYLPAARTALLDAYFDVAEPVKRFFQLRLSLREAAYYAFGALWTLAIWAFPGAIVTRRALVQLAGEATPGLWPTASYACRRYLWYFLAPLYPLLGVLLLTLPIALLGVPLGFSMGVGSVLAGLGWIFVVLMSLAAMWLFGGLIFGWPLMWPTISAERDGDPFEAFSRSYSYVYGKPLHYFFYVVIAAAFGALGWAVVSIAMLVVQEFGFWALSWGAGRGSVEVLRASALEFAAGRPLVPELQAGLKIGATLIGLVVVLIHAVADAFRYTYLFCAASAIYLLLRHDVDAKEIDEVYLETASPSEQAPHDAATPAAAASADSGQADEEA